MKKHIILLFACCLLSLLLAGCTRTQQRELSDATDQLFNGLTEIKNNIVEWLVGEKDSAIDNLTNGR